MTKVLPARAVVAITVFLTSMLTVPSIFPSNSQDIHRNSAKSVSDKPVDKIDSTTIDTIAWDAGSDENFISYPGDVLYQYFPAFSTHGFINEILLPLSDVPETEGVGLEAAIYKSEYPFEPPIPTWDIVFGNDSAAWLGYYDTGNPEPFGDSLQWREGMIYDEYIEYTGAILDPLFEKVWPDSGFASISLEGYNVGDVVNISTVDYGHIPYVGLGERYFLFIRLTGDANNGSDSTRVGFNAGQDYFPQPIPLLKFYDDRGNPSGRLGYDDWGWYIRPYVLDWKLVFEFDNFHYCDMLTSGFDLTSLSYSPVYEPVPIVLTIPQLDAEGVREVTLNWSVNDSLEFSQPMTATDSTHYIAEIPGYPSGSEIDYWVTASIEYMNSLFECGTFSESYLVFQPSSEADGLILDGPGLFNAQYYPFHSIGTFDYWNVDDYGDFPSDFYNYYDTIILLTPDYTVESLSVWLDYGGKSCLITSTEFVPELLDHTYHPVQLDTVPGTGASFLRRLGIQAYYPDINNWQSAWPVYPSQNSVLSSALYDSLGADNTLYYTYDSLFGGQTYLHGLVLDSMVQSAFRSVPHPETGYPQDSLAVGFHLEESLDNKIAYLGFAPGALIDENGVWWGESEANPIRQALEWFGITVDTDPIDPRTLPDKFALLQNYPNPFNPETVIRFELPRTAEVRLEIYDLRGRKVRTLLNEVKRSGNHEVTWDGTDEAGASLSSGMYLYRLSTPNRIMTRKMIILR
ncbi:MAG: hypothetical protein MAGBODY4_01072 [Candidatus Marinimicrobia bacterium]|nr:hypothetical protein [Candidatus Neomarinimicrobiota bacterium]